MLQADPLGVKPRAAEAGEKKAPAASSGRGQGTFNYSGNSS
jgi:hypothetical protein